MSESRQHEPIAIVGMDCLLPNSQGLHEYWRTIRNGDDGITEVPAGYWNVADYCVDEPNGGDYIRCRRGAFIPPTTFDPIEFGIPPTVLEATDTAQLLGLMVAKRALRDAGYDNGREFDRSRTSVILGVTGTQELVLPLGARLGHPLWRRALREAGVDPQVAEEVVERIAAGYVQWQESSFPGLLGNVVAGRIANRLDLHGTNCVVDAACASSLSAAHLAAMELSAGRADMVLTGGVDTLNDIFMFMCFHKAQALSPTGDARAFAADADGTVLGEGVGIMVLKRLADAQRDGDRIYAVLKGIGTSSDGRSQSIYAPLADGQARALRAAYEISGVDPVTVELVEAHGTGTKVGDVVEFEALHKVYRESAAEGRWCALGSVKSQIGHTKAAAGAASMIKAILALHHRVLPATIKVDAPNPKLPLAESPFYINTQTRPWLSRGDHPRRAAVSSFGFGGSNFHAVLEEYPCPQREPAWDGSVELIALCADDAEGLRAALEEWKQAAAGGLTAAEQAARAALSRATFRTGAACRMVLVHEYHGELARLIDDALAGLAHNGAAGPWHLPNVYFGTGERPGALALLFPGQGSQYVNMGRDLACHFPEALDAIAQADADSPGLGERIFPQPTFSDDERRAQEETLTQTEVTQPALGAVSLAMLRVLRRFGIKEDFTGGHSFGELVALRAAGRIGDQALRKLAALRGKLMAEAREVADGAMLAIQAPLEEIETLLCGTTDDVTLANRNSPTQAIISGVRKAVEKVARTCDQRGWRTKMLAVSAAFHSKFMAPAQERFRAALDEITFERGRVPVFANVTGKAYPKAARRSRDLLAAQLTSPVHFVEQIRNLYQAGARTFIEVGPKSVLTGLVRNILDVRPLHAFSLDASGGRGNGLLDLARGLALLAVLGHGVDLMAWERPAPEVPQPKMAVTLTGANYRNPATRPVPHTRRKTTDPQVGTEGMNKSEYGQVGQAAGIHQTPPAPGAPAPAVPVAPLDPARAQQLSQAFAVVQEGLRSMQALQQQTAAAHHQFLQTQQQAHQTFQMVMENQQRLLAGALGLPVELPAAAPIAPLQPVPAPAAPVVSPDAGIAGQPGAAGPQGGGVGQPRAAGPQEKSCGTGFQPVEGQPGAAGPQKLESNKPGGTGVSPVAPARPADASSPPPDEIEQALIALVSSKTGYAPDAIHLDMHLEDDLGIDTIRRSEILAELQARYPHWQPPPAGHLNGPQTLREIVEFRPTIAQATAPPTPAAPPPAAAAPTPVAAAAPSSGGNGQKPAAEQSASAGVDAGAFERIVLEAVAELTGYPPEMLDLDMDMEADLGIDSIKRLEILGAVQRKVPEMAEVNSQYMGSLRTLRNIIDYATGAVGEQEKKVTAPAGASR